jgi:hypothetical protein
MYLHTTVRIITIMGIQVLKGPNTYDGVSGDDHQRGVHHPNLSEGIEGCGIPSSR